MSDEILVALITSWSAVLVAAVGVIGSWVTSRRDKRQREQTERQLTAQLRAVGQDVSATRHQVQNDHGTNLRDDLDRISRRVDDGFSGVHSRLSRLADRVENLDQQDGSLWAAIKALRSPTPPKEK